MDPTQPFIMSDGTPGETGMEDPNQFTPQGAGREIPEEAPEDIEQQILASLDDLEEEDAKLLTLLLTPEFAQVMRALLGDAFGNVFDKLADPSKILIPLNRSQVMDDEEDMDSGDEPPAINQTTEATPPLPTEDTPL